MSRRLDEGAAPCLLVALLHLLSVACLLAAASPARVEAHDLAFQALDRPIARASDPGGTAWARLPSFPVPASRGDPAPGSVERAPAPRVQLASSHTGRRSFWRGQKIRDRDYWAWQGGTGPSPYEADLCAAAGRGGVVGACSAARAEGALWALLRCNDFDLRRVLVAHRGVVPSFLLPGPDGACTLPQTAPLGDMTGVSPAISFAPRRDWATDQRYYPHGTGPDDCYGILYELQIDPALVFPAAGPWPRDPAAIRHAIANHRLFPLNLPGVEGEHVALYSLARRGFGYTLTRPSGWSPGDPEPNAMQERNCPPPVVLPVRIIGAR